MKKRCISILAVLAVLTLLPVAGLAADSITIDTNPVFENGYTTLNWTDSENAGPYTVAYMLDDGDKTPQRAYLANRTKEDSVTAKPYMKVKGLIPGHTYIIGVIDSQNREKDAWITVPEATEFEDGKLKAKSVSVTVEPRYARSQTSSVQGLDRFIASDMLAHIEEYYYGIRYEIRLPKLAYDRDYLVQIVMIAPNGFAETVFADSYVFGSGPRYQYKIKFLGDTFFYNLYQACSDIPAGVYTVQLYLNGMLANTREFKVR